MYKNLILVTFSIVVFSFNANAQNSSALKVNPNYVHQFIYELHQNDAKKIIAENPQQISKMKAFLEHNLHFVQYKRIPKSVTEKLSNFSPVNFKFVQDEFEIKSFNPFLYGFEKINTPKKIHVDGTNYVLFVNPSID